MRSAVCIGGNSAMLRTEVLGESAETDRRILKNSTVNCESTIKNTHSK
jgi:hypothetical protein